tara:strand:+ start:3246 stop:4307 length:1062 start_codon:yes stop_codon:yes gene_type:complete
MNITIVSLNFVSTPIEILEKCSCNKDDTTMYLSTTVDTLFFEEMVIISTCNRTEWVFISPDSNKAIELLFEKIKQKTKVSKSILKEHAKIYKNYAALSHLFEVSCGLKSMVLGENEILSQIKEGYQTAMEFGATGRYLNKLFQLVIGTGKEARSVTGISKGAHSISSIAIEAIREIDPSFTKKPLLLIGAGVMIQRALAKLTAMGHENLSISNRTMSKAEKLAEVYPNLTVLPFASIKKELNQFDSIYIGIHSAEYILTADHFKHFKTQKIVVDVSVPRCVDPACEKLNNITFISVDKLENIANQTISSRRSVIPHVHAIIRVALSEWSSWLDYRNETFDWVNNRFDEAIYGS